MSLHLKLFIPVLLLLAAISATFHFYWLPNYISLEINGQYKTEQAYTDLLGTALIPDLLNSDLAKIHATLDQVLLSPQLPIHCRTDSHGKARSQP